MFLLRGRRLRFWCSLETLILRPIQAREGRSSSTLRPRSGLGGAVVGSGGPLCTEEGSKRRQSRVSSYLSITIRSIIRGTIVVLNAHARLQSRPLKWAAGCRYRLFVRRQRLSGEVCLFLNLARSFIDHEQTGICWLTI